MWWLIVAIDDFLFRSLEFKKEQKERTCYACVVVVEDCSYR